ncbi:hypothetical protein LINGRAHAP2_LOCUS21156 [Linum grandiflorum]
MDHNKALFERVNEIATRKGWPPSQLALASVHHQGMMFAPFQEPPRLKTWTRISELCLSNSRRKTCRTRSHRFGEA